MSSFQLWGVKNIGGIFEVCLIRSPTIIGEIKSEVREQIDAKVIEWKEEGRAK